MIVVSSTILSTNPSTILFTILSTNLSPPIPVFYINCCHILRKPAIAIFTFPDYSDLSPSKRKSKSTEYSQ